MSLAEQLEQLTGKVNRLMHHLGCCVEAASLLCALLRELGHDARVVTGSYRPYTRDLPEGIPAPDGCGRLPHAWVCVDELVCDPTRDQFHPAGDRVPLVIDADLARGQFTEHAWGFSIIEQPTLADCREMVCEEADTDNYSDGRLARVLDHVQQLIPVAA